MKTLVQIMLLSMISFASFASSSVGESMAVDSENCAIIAQQARFEQEVGNYDISSSSSTDQSGVTGR